MIIINQKFLPSFTSNENQSVHDSIRTRPGGILKPRILYLAYFEQASVYPSEIYMIFSSVDSAFLSVFVCVSDL